MLNIASGSPAWAGPRQSLTAAVQSPRSQASTPSFTLANAGTAPASAAIPASIPIERRSAIVISLPCWRQAPLARHSEHRVSGIFMPGVENDA
jgi:hypothetical protein